MKRGALSRVRLRGLFAVEHWRAGRLLGVYRAHNGVTNVGQDNALDVLFHADTQITTWYIGLIDNAGFTTLAPGDTMSSHAGWAESVVYSDANRITWPEDAASGQAITNSVTADFTINGSASLRGLFLTSDNTKSGTSGILYATALLGSIVPVQNTDTLRTTYTVTGSDETP